MNGKVNLSSICKLNIKAYFEAVTTCDLKKIQIRGNQVLKAYFVDLVVGMARLRSLPPQKIYEVNVY